MLRRKTKWLFAFLGAILTLETVLVIVNYPVLPQRIPVFLDVLGNVLFSIDKGWFTSIRLSLMGLVAFGLCWAAYVASRNAADSIRSHILDKCLTAFWTTLAVALTLKTTMETLSLFYVQGDKLLAIGRALQVGMMGVVLAGLVIAGYEIVKIYSNHPNFMTVVSKKTPVKHQIMFVGLTLVYVVLVVFPKFV